MEKKEIKFRLMFLLVLVLFIIILVVSKLFVYGDFEEKVPELELIEVSPTLEALPSNPRGEKILFKELPTQDTTIVFKVPFLDEIKTSEIRNVNNAVIIWRSKGKSTFQIILMDKYPDWSPNVSGGTFKLKNGKILTVRFENEPRPDNFPSALDPDAWK